MSIWQKAIHLEGLNQRGVRSMSDFLGIEFLAIEENALIASMPVNQQTRQPAGILHGGASCVLAETVGSTAANYCVDESHWCVGLEINANHIRAKKEGLLIATASPIHLGRSTQVWNIEMRDEEKKLIAISRLTMAVLKRP